MTGQSIIEAKSATAGYGGRALWRDASLAIGKGEFVAVLGPNGAGKTTLFKLLLGLAQPLGGRLSVFGNTPRRGNAKIGYVPQRHVVDSESAIEALEVVRLGTCAGGWGFDTPRGAAKERAEAMRSLESVGASHLAHRPLGALSGGEQQRIFLAQALAGGPELLLLDEPLANMDIRRESELVQLIAGFVKDRGVTVLLIAHNINPLLGALDRVIYIANGKVATGNPEEVLTSESLSLLYGAHVEVLRDSRGRLAIVGGEDDAHRHE